MKSHKMIDLANKYSKKHKLIGLRQGEKMIELLLTESEKETSKETKEMWTITTYKNSTN